MRIVSSVVEEFLERLPLASDLAITHLAKFRSLPPASSGLEVEAYQRLFAQALADAHAAVEVRDDSGDLYALLDRAADTLRARINDSTLLSDALGDSGAFAAEGSVRAFVLASVIRSISPSRLSEFAAAVLKIPAATALEQEPVLETVELG